MMDPPSLLLCKYRNELILTAAESLRLPDITKRRNNNPKKQEDNLTSKTSGVGTGKSE